MAANTAAPRREPPRSPASAPSPRYLSAAPTMVSTMNIATARQDHHRSQAARPDLSAGVSELGRRVGHGGTIPAAVVTQPKPGQALAQLRAWARWQAPADALLVGVVASAGCIAVLAALAQADVGLAGAADQQLAGGLGAVQTARTAPRPRTGVTAVAAAQAGRVRRAAARRASWAVPCRPPWAGPGGLWLR